MTEAGRLGATLTDGERSRGIVALMVSTTVGLIGQFMFSPLLVFLLQARGLPASQIGLSSATVWLGVLVAVPQASRVVSRIGHRNALTLSLAIPCLTMTGIAASSSLWVWTPLYFLAGMAVSMRWVVAEACIAELAPAHRRGRIVGLYQTLLGASFVVSPMLLAWLGPTDPGTVWIGLLFPLVGLTVTFLVPDLGRLPQASQALGLRALLRSALAMPLPVVAGVVAGFFELGIAAMLPIYGLAIGMGTAGVALLLSASGLGSTLAMLPLGEAADRFSPRRVMRLCAIANLGAALMLPAVAFSTALAWPLAFVWGAAGGALYTLTMIEIGHSRSGKDLISATSLLVIGYTLGSLTGPVVSGLAIEWSLQVALPIVFTVAAALGWWALVRCDSRP